MKTCKKCELMKPLNDYHKHSKSKDGRQTVCKQCRNALDKIYRDSNKDKISITRKKYREENKDKIRGIQNKYRRERKKIDPTYKLKNSVRRSINNALKREGYPKNSKTQEILGCTFEEFKQHIESQWENWMSWDNYGLYNGKEGYGWDIDHITPTSSAINENDIINLNHYTNLQPLCSYINRVLKKDKI